MSVLSYGVQSHHFFLVWRSEPPSLHKLAFKATISFQLRHSESSFTVWRLEPPASQYWCLEPFSTSVGHSEPPYLFSLCVHSHHLLTVRLLKPSSLLSYDVQSLLSQFDIQRFQFSIMAFKVFIFFSLAFRVAFLVQHLESPSLHSLAFRAFIFFSLTFGVASLVQHSEPSSLLNYDVQSRLSQFDIQRCQFLVMTFRAFIFFSLTFRVTYLVQRLESLSLHSLTFRAFTFFKLVFRVVSPTWRSESLSLLSYGVQGLHLLQYGVQSHISNLGLRATIPSQFRRSKPSFLFSLAFRVTVPSQFDVQSHYPITIEHSLPSFRHSGLYSQRSRPSFTAQHSEPSYLQFGIQSHQSA